MSAGGFARILGRCALNRTRMALLPRGIAREAFELKLYGQGSRVAGRFVELTDSSRRTALRPR
jgi:hypothetical protein